MGINPTQPNHKAFTFDGTSSRDYGVYITGEAVFNAPQRDVQMVDIPGRNGAYALDKGNFNNITVKYPASIVADNETDFAEAVSDLRNFLCSKTGYCRLEDEYNPDEYRMAIYKSGLEVEHDMLIAGEFDITFDCKPQRYLTSGEELITIGEWRDVQTAEGAVATFEADSATLIKSLTADIDPIQDLNGYDSPWVGGGGVNLLNPTPYEGLSYNTASGTAVSLTASSTEVTQLSNGLSYPISTAWKMIAFKTAPLSAGEYHIQVVSASTASRISVYVVDADGNTKESAYNMVGTGTMSITKTVLDNEYLILSAGLNVAGTVTITNAQIQKGSSFTTYSPYSNICPISGWNSVGVVDDPTYGGFINWNQLCDNGNFAVSSGWTPTYGSVLYGTNELTYSVTTVGTQVQNRIETDTLVDVVKDHKYLISATIKASASVPFVFQGYGSEIGARTIENITLGSTTANTYSTISGIVTAVLSGKTKLRYAVGAYTGKAIGDSYKYKNFLFYDLTQMFGAGNEPTTVDEFKAIFPNNYYAYNSGTKTNASAVNGTPYISYTTSLGTTVYGGTLDVVSGNGEAWQMDDLSQLSTTQIYTGNINRTLTVTLSSSYNGYPLTGITMQAEQYKVQGYVIGQAYLADPDSTDCGIYWYRNSGATTTTRIYIVLPLATSLSGKIVYEKATPTAISATPTTIQTLLGTNNIFADSGDVTVEYGQNPMVLINPTPFEAEPLLAIDGYGTIGFNGSTVTVNSSNIGKTIVYGGSTRKKEYDDEGGPTLLEVMYLRDLDFLNNGDNIIFKGIRGQNNLSMPVTSSVINSTSGMFVSSAFQQNTLSFFWEFDEKILTLGTATTWTASWSGTVKSNGVTSTYTFTTSFSYDGDDYIRIQFPSGWEGNNGGSYVLDIPILYGDSTRPIPYNPCYVDLEIGEAYIIENNTILSINNAVSLPSDLPRLSSGTNTFTYDNTVTSLEVTPRWWKV